MHFYSSWYIEAKVTHDEQVSDATYLSIGETPLSDRNGIVAFQSKFDTDLYALIKKKSNVISLAISPNGTHFALYGSDRKIRLFDFKSGKTKVQYDEWMKVYYAQLQKRQAAANSYSSKANTNCTSTDGHSGGMDAIDYGNRSAREEKEQLVFALLL